MTAVLERRYSPAAEWSRGIAAFSAVLLVTSALAHRYGLVEAVPFFWLLALSGALALCGLCLAVVGFVQIWEHGVAGLKAAALGLLLSLVALSPFAVSAYWLAIHPRLTDISTDLLQPPRLDHAAARRVPPMNPVRPIDREAARLQLEAYPELGGRRYEHAKENVAAAVEVLVAERGWKPVAPVQLPDAEGSTTLEVVARSFLMGFPSDVAIRIQDGGDATYVDMRSASRYGRHDMGENAERIKRFLNELDQRMEAAGS